MDRSVVWTPRGPSSLTSFVFGSETVFANKNCIWPDARYNEMHNMLATTSKVLHCNPRCIPPALATSVLVDMTYLKFQRIYACALWRHRAENDHAINYSRRDTAGMSWRESSKEDMHVAPSEEPIGSFP